MSSYEINAETSRTGERVIELHGEFDIHSLRDLSDALWRGADSYHATSVDLSGVTFADLCALRELSDALLSYPGLSLNSPSWQVLQSARSCELENRLGFGPAFAEVSLKAS
jgi:hypothetical protein